jgi:mono/diheme cytochrome c family protein
MDRPLPAFARRRPFEDARPSVPDRSGGSLGTSLRQLTLAFAIICGFAWGFAGESVGGGVVGTHVEADPPSFESEIWPLLAAKCLDCHGPETDESGFRVDLRASMLAGGDYAEPAVVPGDPDASHLIQVVTGRAGSLLMPPQGPRLSPDEISLLRRWVAGGGQMPQRVAAMDADATDEPSRTDPAQGPALAGERAGEHWAFRPVVRPQLPLPTACRTASEPACETEHGLRPTASGIDTLIQQRLQSIGLSPNPPLERRQLIRRLYLLALGIPPHPDQIERFVVDPDPRAYHRLVDQVLANPRFGETWAQHWLDLIRFAESDGFETNRTRSSAWPYRDYVVWAFNHDLPYRQFVQEQLAGDSMGRDVATGFLVAGPHDIVLSPDPVLTRMQRQDELTDLVNTVGTAFLGLTLGCARCHNHKFDPWSQRDFYALQAALAGVRHGTRPLDPAQAPQAMASSQQLERLHDQLCGFEEQGLRRKRPAVNAVRNEERFEPRPLTAVRFTIEATNSGEPCLDELEVWSAQRNIALAATGAVASCSSQLPGYAIHKLEHIHDGLTGNQHSWISNEPGRGTVEIAWPQPAIVERVVWGRDRSGQFADRLAIEYRVEGRTPDGRWQLLTSSHDRAPWSADGTGTERPTRLSADNYDPSEMTADARHEVERLLDQLRSLERQRDRSLWPANAYIGRFEQPAETQRLYRGDPMAPREVIPPGLADWLGGWTLASDSPEQQRRLALAESICRADNPLLRRVAVNRIWQHYFGRGLVATPSDFGRNGAAPSHPELLDWLASELLDHDDSIKAIHRQILLSDTFQQLATSHPDGQRLDADAALLWRFPSRRLSAEAIRDSLLLAAGSLDSRLGGAGFSGFEVDPENVHHYFPKQQFGPEDWRRMLYMTKVRQESEAVFGAFDCPDAGQVTPRRNVSTTPLQALNLFNSPFVWQQSELLVRRVERQLGRSAGLAERIELMFLSVLGRSATSQELAEAAQLCELAGLASVARALFNSNEFLFVP